MRRDSSTPSESSDELGTQARDVTARVGLVLPDRFSVAAVRANVGGSFTDLWPLSADMTYATVAAQPIVVSTSVQDAASGTGARRVRILGWSGNWNLDEEDVALNGTTGVTATKRFIRIISIRVTGTGSIGSNVGDITATIGGVTAGFVALTDNRSLHSQFFVPPDHEGVFDNFRVSAAFGGTQIDYGAIRLMARFDGGGPFFTIEELSFSPWTMGGTGPSVVLPGPADFTLRTFGSGAGSNKRVSGGYDVRLRRANTRRTFPL